MDTKRTMMSHIAVNAIQISVLIFLLSAMLVSCSKGDDGPNLSNDTNGNNGSHSNIENDPIGASITIKSMEPASPATLKFGDSIAIAYDFNVTRSLGARIWIQPFANGNLAPSSGYSLSPVYKGTGTQKVYVSVSEGDTTVVDQLKTQINTAGLILLGVLTASDKLSESFEDVDYMFVI